MNLFGGSVLGALIRRRAAPQCLDWKGSRCRDPEAACRAGGGGNARIASTYSRIIFWPTAGHLQRYDRV